MLKNYTNIHGYIYFVLTTKEFDI